ncbi:MAG: SsrA-binding protein SmpB [Opitutales bacterium]|nr:SsrA-binding protein SmpB [Opitutales bacterium]
MPKNSDTSARVAEIRNRKASHNYFIGETFEAGIVLTGTEVKSVRMGRAQLQESFVRISAGLEAVLYNAHISEYDFGNFYNHVPTRERKLLLHKKEILKLKAASERDGLAIIPVKMYFSKGRVKVLIALCKGKKLFDKRESLKKSQALREANRAMSLRNFK